MNDPIDTTGRPPRQRSARNNASMRDGDSSNGSPLDPAGDEVEFDSDNDIGDDAAGARSVTEEAIDDVLTGRTGQQFISVDPDALDRLADGHAGPDDEAMADDER